MIVVMRPVALFPSAYFPSLGGVEELSARLAAEIHHAGGECTVWTMRWPRDLPSAEVIDGVAVRRGRFCLPEPTVRSLIRFTLDGPRAFVGLLSDLRRRQAGIVHVQCVSSNGAFAWLAARCLRTPLVVSLQGELTMDSTAVYQRTRVLPWTLRQLLRRADAVTACSAATLAEAEQFVGFSLGNRGRVIYNGVALAEMRQASIEKRERSYVLAIGRHVKQKGFDVLIEAFSTSVASMTHDLVIAGDGPDRASLERMAARSSRSESIVFVGRTDRARTTALFKGCDLFVLPSRHEPLGIVNLEAMAAGRPVVASAVGGVPEVVLDGVTGLLVPPEDVGSLTAAIDRVVLDKGFAQRLGSAGATRAELFDWPKIAGEYLALYAELGCPVAQP